MRSAVTISSLPDDALFHVFTFLEPRDLGRIARVSQLWHDTAAEDELWRRLALAFIGAVEFPEQHQPEHGQWKSFFLRTFWMRNFDEKRHHSVITVNRALKMASVVPDAQDSNYKGCMVTPAIPMAGKSHFQFVVKFTDENDKSDHIALGIANSSFNTTKHCPEGWNANNAGCGWYSSNGAVYMGDQYTRTENDGNKNDTIHDGDVLDVLIDRTEGTLRFQKNGKMQPVGAQGEHIKTGELFICFILMHHIEVKFGASFTDDTELEFSNASSEKGRSCELM